MCKIMIPEDVQNMLDELQKNGFSAYIVGGCVRDSILGKIPHDYDICTSAKPNDMLSVFKEYDIYETGLQHGTLTVAGNDDMYEITTYRTDGEYKDGRHPETVSFVDNIEEDLSRRDFTINAMAYNNEVGLIDPFNGQEDINKKLIRCVGNPNNRFNEDALRILRAIRFASTYGFDIEDKTKLSIHKNKHLLQKISAERITSEFSKIISCADANLLDEYKDVFAEFIPEIKPMFHLNQHNPWHCYDVYMHTAHAVENAPKNDIIVRLAMFFHDIGKPEVFTIGENGVGHFYGHPIVSAEMQENIMRRMKFDNNTIKFVNQLIENHDRRFNGKSKNAKKILRDIGEEQTRRLITVQKCDTLAQAKIPETAKCLQTLSNAENVINEIIENKEPYKISDLAINGNDIVALGITGPSVKKVLEMLVNNVIGSPKTNTKESLLKIATNFAKEENILHK